MEVEEKVNGMEEIVIDHHFYTSLHFPRKVY